MANVLNTMVFDRIRSKNQVVAIGVGLKSCKCRNHIMRNFYSEADGIILVEDYGNYKIKPALRKVSDCTELH